MTLPLQPLTKSGRRFVQLMEQHAAEFAAHAAELDRAGRFAGENIRALSRSGALAAAVPEELGGLGVRSLHDLGLGVCRLARGDASTAIASWMHLVATSMMARSERALNAAGKQAAAERLERILRGVADARDVIAVLASETGTYADYPQTRATRVDDGFVIEGMKVFGTLAQAATHLNVAVQIEGADGKRYHGFAFVPRATAGVRVNDDWDALGMRASGSGSVVFDRCRVASDAVSQMGELGVQSAASLYLQLGVNVGLIAACIGVAEAARDEAIRIATSRKKLPRDRPAAARVAIQHLLGEIDVTLHAVHATFAHNACAIDQALANHTPRSAALADMRRLDADSHATKIFVERSCAEIVDRCLTASGGSGYLSKSPLARHYRDVRALPFMFPQATETLQYIGMVALGVEPVLDL